METDQRSQEITRQIVTDVRRYLDDVLPAWVQMAVEDAVKALPHPRAGEKGEKGDPGPQGADGAGIQSAQVRGADLVLTFTDGRERSVGRVVGPCEKGERGEVGPAGPASTTPGPRGEPGRGIQTARVLDGALVLTMSDGQEIKAGPVAGPQGAPGPIGPRGEKGDPGRGIASARVLDGSLRLTLTDGTEINAGSVVGPAGPKGEKGDPSTVPGPVGPTGAKGDSGRDGRDGQSLTGPAGPPGRDGKDGVKGDPGRDGKDGASIEQVEAAAARMLSEIKVEGRTWKLGKQEIRMPIPEYRGVWTQGTEYGPGDMVTWDGSLWHCNAAGTEKPGNDPTWTLVAKRGRDGRSARA